MCGHHARAATIWSAAFLTGMVSAQPTQALRNIRIGDQVPAFSVKALDGNTVSKTGCAGKVLLLIFARPEQEESLEALRAAQRILRDNSDSRLSVLAVSSKPTAGDYFKRLASDKGFTFPIALDPERKMYGDFGLLVSPTTLLIDGKGVLRYELAHMPPNYERRLRIHMDHLLGRISQKEHDALLAPAKPGESEYTDSYERRLALARTFVDQNKLEQAVSLLTKLRSESDSTLATALLATAYLRLDKVDEAARCLDPIADTKPAPPVLTVALARLELYRKNDGEAEKYLLEAVKTSPKKGLILFELGRLYERQGKLGKAVECYRKALEEAYEGHR
jgi:tetratricopeptide (TPR) repeat protein